MFGDIVIRWNPDNADCAERVNFADGKSADGRIAEGS
jgi:hypothetical protein